MSNRTKIVLIVILTIVLVGLLVRSLRMLQAVSPSKPSAQKESAKAPTPATIPSQPSLQTTPPPPKITGLSLALPPRNPFNPLVSEKKETTPPSQPTPPHLPAPVISQVPSAQAPSLPTNLILMGTVIGPQRLAIIKIEGKSIIVKQGEKVDGLTLKKVDRGRVVLEGLEIEMNLKGGEPK